MADRDGSRERKAKKQDASHAPAGSERAVGASGTGTQAAHLLTLQRAAGNRATSAALGAAGPSERYLSAAEWSRRTRLPEASSRPVSVQRLGNPVSPALKGHRHELGAAETAYMGGAGGVDLQRGMAPAAAAKYKMAIKELQRKLIAALGGRIAAGIWKRDGVFGSSTEAAVKKFQGVEGLPVTGVVNDVTWRRIDARGVGSSRGREEFSFEQQMTEEGVGGGDLVTGGVAAFDWAKKEDVFDINVGVKFTGATVHEPLIVKAIQSVWNTFALQYKGAKAPGGKKRKPKNPRVALNFNVGAGQAKPGAPVIAADTAVYLFEPPHPNWAARGLASEEDKKSRSDMLNWNVKDAKLPVMAAHEFGHLIGLEDEYARPHDAMQRVAGPVAAYSDPTVVGAATTWATDLAKAKTSAEFSAVFDQAANMAAVDGRLETAAQIHKTKQGTRMSAAYRTAAKTQKDLADNRAAAAEVDLTAAQKAAQQSLVDLKTATTDLGVAQLALDKRPDVDQTIKTALANAKARAVTLATEVKTAETAGEKSALYAVNVKESLSATLVTANAWAQVATDEAKGAGDAATRAKAASDAVGVEVTAATNAIKTVNDTRAQAQIDARKASGDASAQAKVDSGTANLASEALNARRDEWQTRGRMGVGNQEARDQAMAKVSADLDAAKLVQTNAINASKAATKAARDARSAVTQAKSAGVLAGTVANASSKEAAGYLAGADAYTVTGTKAVPVASDYREAVHINDLSTRLVAALASIDSTGFATAGVMGNFHLDAKALRENSPALEHSHPLQARHVNRFAEYIMKYKPGDLWEPVKR